MERRSEFRECEGEEDDDDVEQDERAVTDVDDDSDDEIGNDFGAVAPVARRPRAPLTQPGDAGKLATRGMRDGADPRVFLVDRASFARREKLELSRQ